MEKVINRKIYEGRVLVNIAGTLIRQEELSPIYTRLNWEKLFRTADYHRIANLAYLGMLGNTEKANVRWKERFFERYQEALLFGEICSAAEKEILSFIDMNEITCTILASTEIRRIYIRPEMSANHALRLYLSEDYYTLLKGYLIDLGYETERFFPEYGERMVNAKGFPVEIYKKLPFMGKNYEKQMLQLVERAKPKESYRYVRKLSREDQMVFRLAEAAYHYVNDELRIRELLDIYLCYRLWEKKLNREHISEKLMAMNVDKLCRKLLRISYMWFGNQEDLELTEEEQELEMSVYDVIENRVLSNGTINDEIDTQALDLVEAIHVAEEQKHRLDRKEQRKKERQERRKERKKRIRWMFPEYRYMCSIYPILEKIPILLPFCWIVRGFRMLRIFIRNSRKES